MPRATRPLSFLLLVAVSASILTVMCQSSNADVPKPSDIFKRKIGNYTIFHPEFYTKWNNRRDKLGNATSNEVKAQATGTTTGGTVMTFVRGIIFRIGEGGSAVKQGKLAGKVVAVYGPIYTKYKELAGLEGALGCPQADQFKVNAQGDVAQLFELGLVTYSPTKRKFFIDYAAR